MRSIFVVALATLLAGCVTDGTPAPSSRITSIHPAAAPARPIVFANPRRAPNADLPMFGGNATSAELDRERSSADAWADTMLKNQGWTRNQTARHLLALGLQALQRGDGGRAIGLLNRTWLLDPDIPALWWGFGFFVEKRDEDLRAAESMYRRGLELADPPHSLYASLGRILVSSGRTEEALGLLRTGNQRFPQSVHILANLGSAEVDSGQVSGCERVLAAVKQEPGFLDEESFVTRLKSPLCRDVPGSAAATATKQTIQKEVPVFANPNNLPAAELPMWGGGPSASDLPHPPLNSIAIEEANRGAVSGARLVSEGNFAMAVRHLNASWVIDPTNALVFHGLATVVFRRDKDIKGAEYLWQRALALPRADGGMYAAYGGMLLSTGRAQEAVALLRTGQQKFPGHQLIRGALIAAEVEIGDRTACGRARDVARDAAEPVAGLLRQALAKPVCR